MQVNLHSRVTRDDDRPLNLIREVDEDLVVRVFAQELRHVLRVEYLWRWAVLLQSGDVDLFQEFWPILV